MNNLLNIKTDIDTLYRKILINDYSLDIEDTLYFNSIFSIEKELDCKSKIELIFRTFSDSENTTKDIGKITLSEYIVVESVGKINYSLKNSLLVGNYIMEIQIKKNLFSFKLINPDSSVQSFRSIKRKWSIRV
jgi:hypothetical protein